MRAVLMFHGIDERPGPLSYPVADFEALLGTLLAADLPIIDLDTLLLPTTSRGVALTFDDGMRSVLHAALPILRQFRAPAHLFLHTGAVEQPPANEGAQTMMTWDEVAQLARCGVAIECHTHRHLDLRTLTDLAIESECATADALIDRHVGRKPRYFAYPFGHADRRVARVIGARYAAALTNRLGFVSARAAQSRLPRIDAHYLRGRLARRPLTEPSLRAYLLLRKALRKIRGSE